MSKISAVTSIEKITPMKASGNISFQIAEDLDEVDVFLNIFLPLLFKLFFATAITKYLNSLKISQLQKSQINTKITSKCSTHLHQNLQHIYTKIFNTLTSKFSTHLHQNFQHIYTKIFFTIYKTFTYLFKYLFICMVCTITFSFWYSQIFCNSISHFVNLQLYLLKSGLCATKL